MFIAFTARGLETWADPKRRDYMLKGYLKYYKEDREALEYDLKRLRTK